MLSLDKANNQKNTIAVLDGVRAVACFLVIAYHLNRITNIEFHSWNEATVGKLAGALSFFGWSGVTLFFVLSGFLLFMPFARTILFETDWPSHRRFYLRRALRILPGYYVALFALIFWLHPEFLHVERLGDLALFLLFLMDVPQTYQQINGPFWTLAVEWQFYMLLPWLALAVGWIVYRVGRNSVSRRWWMLVACLGVLAVWGVFTHYWGYYFQRHLDATFLVPRPVLDAILVVVFGTSGKYWQDFAMGMLLSSCFVFVTQSSPEHGMNWLKRGVSRYSYWLWGAGVLTLFYIATWAIYRPVYSLHPLMENFFTNENWRWGAEGVVALGFTLCLAALLFGPATLRRPLEWPILRWLGLISYGLYIWHLPLLNAFKDFIRPFAQDLPSLVLYLLFWLFVALVIVPFCYLFFKLVEQPWMKLGERLDRRRRPTPTTKERETAPAPEQERLVAGSH